jgi:3-oxoadipate enol-lactonase
MYYEQQGSGPDLLLVCGLGADLRCGSPQLPALRERFRVTVFDNRGIGRTDAPDEPYAVRQMADEAAALLDLIGVRRAHVVGTSMGGMIAQDLAAHHPRKVDHLVLACTRINTGPIRKLMAPITRFLWTHGEELTRQQRILLTMPWAMTASFVSDEARVLEALEGAKDDPFPTKVHAYLRQLDAAGDHDASAYVGSITAPTLVLVGREDLITPVTESEALAAAIPGSTLRVLPRGGHGFFTEYADDVNTAILEFLGGRA